MQPPETFSFAKKSKLIIFHSEEICKENFYDRAEVKKTARLRVRRGEIVCAVCSGPLTVHACYSRHCIDEAGTRHDGWIAQGHCGDCDVYPALIPSFIRPHKHYKADAIERVIKKAQAGDNVEHLGGCVADISTMRRWVRQWGACVERAVCCLIPILPTVRKGYTGSLDLQSMTPLQQLVRLLSDFPAPMLGGVIGRANIILTTHNCGFL